MIASPTELKQAHTKEVLRLTRNKVRDMDNWANTLFVYNRRSIFHPYRQNIWNGLRYYLFNGPYINSSHSAAVSLLVGIVGDGVDRLIRSFKSDNIFTDGISMDEVIEFEKLSLKVSNAVYGFNRLKEDCTLKEYSAAIKEVTDTTFNLTLFVKEFFNWNINDCH